MKIIHISSSLLFFGITAQLSAQTELSVQSNVRPYNLDIVSPVMQAGSDADSAQFQADVLPDMLSFIDANLSESQSVSNLSTISLDPSKLYLHNDASVRIYFLGEGAGYHNTLGFNTEGGSVDSGEPMLIFPDASSVNSYYTYGDTTTWRSKSAPLMPGDFVDLGVLEAGTQLDFFLIANGAYGGSLVWSTDTSVNVDGLVHTVSLAQDGSPYLLIGFEDLYGGGDKDYNDLLFAVDIGAANVAYLANPEPSTWLIMGLFTAGVLYLARRRDPDLAYAEVGCKM
ncbi:DUF4114 domain-containing protein [Cerasicoccus maritimus]|uniref:DUF4114 domain-containing protein n=1 Tax=Cerasicoccus maritimus TaxID=490089 RepID=UPI002852C0AA|nr:DUF4114 domain-containing protein [Cerasicoccus maritimus]